MLTGLVLWNYIVNLAIAGLSATFVVRKMKENRKRKGL